jgi:parallel beta-helix repeat protein
MTRETRGSARDWSWVLVLAVLIAVCAPLVVAAAWVEGANPVFEPPAGVYYPSVLYDADAFSGHGASYPYKLWYSNGSATAVGLAASNDGLSWTVLSSAVTGLASPHHVQVLYDAGGFGGTGYLYRIWYWCQSSSIYDIGAIHTAESADGVSWSNDQALTQFGTSVVVDNGTNWNRGSYGPIALIYNAAGSATLDDANIFNNRYVMYYDGTTGSQEAWGLAYSTDGLLWKGYNGGLAPVLPVGGAGTWDQNYTAHGSVVHGPSTTWDAWYGGGVAASSEGIGHATSPDGIAWTRDSANPLTDLGCASPPSGLGCAGTWNATRNYTPVVLAWPSGSACPARDLKMWRSGRDAAGNKVLGFASAVSPAVKVRHVPADYPTIQAAITASNPGDTVQIAAATFAENVVLDKPIELAGAGAGATILMPALSNPDCGGVGGSDPLCAGASSVILVQSGCVTIRDLTVDGDNPSLSGGITVNGANVNARNGIILNEPLGPFDYFTVTDCQVKNVYLRGIYAYQPPSASLKPHLSLRGNTVDNVAGSADFSIGIFSRHCTGTIQNNTVSNCPDAISANWSHGLQFLNNAVTASGSGVHTDNAGNAPGDSSDVLRGNVVTSGTAFGGYPIYGVWAFNPYSSVTIANNTVDGADIGVAVHGSGSPSGMVAFSGNVVNGSARVGSRGALVSTDLLGWGSADASATFTGDRLQTCGTGLEVDQQAGYASLATVTGARITDNRTGVLVNGSSVSVIQSDLSFNSSSGVDNVGGTAIATCNWWGNASGPTTALNPGGSGTTAAGPVTFAPWLTAAGGDCDGAIATHLAFTVQPPASTLAGQALTPAVVVQVLDASGHLCTHFNGAIALVLSGGAPSATLSGGSATVSNGVATFPALSVDLAGTAYQLRATFTGLTSALSDAFDILCGVPAVVYVDKAWTGLPNGASVTANGGPHVIGCDAFAVIQDGVNAVANAGTVNVAAGTYLAEVKLLRPVLLHGAGIDVTVLMGPKTGSDRALSIEASGITVEGFTVTRDGNNPTDWATNAKVTGVQFNQGVTGSTLRYCKVTGNRNGVYVNNAQGNTIRNNVVDFNRTGIHLVNNVTGTQITQNTVTNNWTLGIIFNTVFGGGETSATTGLTVSNNNVSSNWYTQVECRWNLSTATLDVSGNWLGSSALVVSSLDASEPGYSAQIPVEYGGTATNPGGAASVGGHTSNRIDYTPWLNSGTDTDPGTIGFQGDFSYLNVGAASPQWGSTPRIAEGIGLVTTGGTVKLTGGNYPENVVVSKALSLLGPNVGKTGWDGTRVAEALLMPTTVGPYILDAAHRTTTLRITVPDVTVDGLAFDGHNPALTGGVPMDGVEVHAACGISNWAGDHDAAGAVAPRLTLKECTFAHFGYAAIDLDATPAPQAGTVVRDNYFTSLDPGNTPIYGWGVGIALEDNYYADVLNNHGDNIRKGVQPDNFWLANPGNPVSISGSDFRTWRMGVYENLQYQSASPFTISGNTFRAESASTSNRGLTLSSIQDAVGVTVLNNDVIGGWIGFEGWNIPTTSPLTIQGGSVTGAQYGVVLWNNQIPGYGFSSGDSHLRVTGTTLTGCTAAGIRVFDDPTNTNAPSGLFLTADAVTATACATGLLVDGADASAIVTASAFKSGSNGVVAQNGGTASATGGDLSGNASFGANNLNAGGSPMLMATCDWWGSASGPTAATNPGGTGSAASAGVAYTPWSTTLGGVCNGAVATHLAFSVQPSLSVAGNLIAPAVVVQALDASEHVAVGFAGTITLALSGGTPGALLSGGSATAVNGVATFGSLSVNLAGPAYHLTASFAGLTPATSSPFDVWAVPTVVYAKKAWTGSSAGTLVTANGGPHIIGYDAFAVIQDGLNAVASSGTVYVYPTATPTDGYAENLTIAKPLTLAKAPDAGASDVVVYPAISNPNCGGAGGGSLCAGASSIILVRANNVLIHDLTLDGDNPLLASGIVRKGADLDARNGIITDHNSGSFTNLEVHHCTVRNIYLRGMYASSGGTFNFHDDVVTNVQGDGGSIGMFAWYGPGTFAYNTVTYCNDAISANHSKGIQFLHNTVTDSGSGIHTDNAGDGGGVADLIRWNDISNGVGGYGIFTFVPYLAPTVEDNTITNCDVGLSAWGQGAAVTPVFQRNTVKLIAPRYRAAGSVGAYITTDLISYGYTDVSADFQDNTISGYETGIYLTADPQSWNPETYVPHAINATFFNNSVYDNATGLSAGTLGTYHVTANCNWWGSDTGPYNATFNPAGLGNAVDGRAIFVPWATTPGPGYTCGGGAPTITGITDVAPCAQSGIQVSYTGTPQATSYDLYADGSRVVTGYASGVTYNPGDAASHAYVVRAILPVGYVDSASSSFADVNGTPLPATNVQVTNPDCTGARITFTASGAQNYELWVDSVLIGPAVPAGTTYTPPDGAIHNYVIRAINNTCHTDSTPVAYAVVNLTPPRVTDSLMLTKTGNNLLLSWDLILPASVVDYYQVGRFLPQEGGPPVFNAVIGTASGQVNGIQVSLSGEPASADYLVRAVKGTCYGPWQ